MGPLPPGSLPEPGACLSEGLERFRRADWNGALEQFQRFEAHTHDWDPLVHVSRSYHGLARVMMGDDRGVFLCRKAAGCATGEADLFYNLAVVEMRLNQRRRAVAALHRALMLAPSDPKVLRLRQHLRVRRRQPIPFLPRNHVLNRFIGKLLRRSQ